MTPINPDNRRLLLKKINVHHTQIRLVELFRLYVSYICIYACNVCMYVYICILMHLYSCMCVCMFVCMYEYVCVCVCDADSVATQPININVWIWLQCSCESCLFKMNGSKKKFLPELDKNYCFHKVHVYNYCTISSNKTLNDPFPHKKNWD